MPCLRRIATLSIAVAVLLPCVPTARAADWSRWLGPSQNGIAPDRDLFGASPRLDIAWTKPLGIAYSAIAVADGRLVTMYGDGEIDWLVALDASSGETLWRLRMDKMFPKIGGAHGGQLSMPVVESGTVYALGARGQLVAVDLDDGSKLWRVRVDKKLRGKAPHFGFTTTPLVVDDLLFVQTSGDNGHSLTALDRATGKLRWSIGDERVGYQSPVLMTLGGRRQIVGVTNTSVLGLAADDGAVLWRTEHGLSERDGWATPISLGDDDFVLTAQNESAAYRVTSDDGAHRVEPLWRSTALKKSFAMPVVHDGHIFGYDADFLTCVDAATGKRLWKERSAASGLILVDDHILIATEDGHLVVAQASADGYEERTRVRFAEEGGFTFPSFADGSIYVRNMDSVARIDVVSAGR